MSDTTVDRARKLTIAAQLVRTVAAIHERRLAHRDLKPENVILRDRSEPVLIDLGLAALSDATDTLTGMGTPRYAAPEQWLREPPDPRWFGREDVFALGKIIEDLNADDTPAAKTGAFAALKKRMRGNVGPAANLLEVISRMTAEEPADRDIDLRDVARALDEAASAARTPPAS
jgi:serine/threonine protein kinase